MPENCDARDGAVIGVTHPPLTLVTSRLDHIDALNIDVSRVYLAGSD